MNKLIKYLNYTNAYLVNGDIRSIYDSLRFLLFNKGALQTRVTTSYLGKVKIRKGTNDFQYANYYYEWNVKSYILSICHNYNVYFDAGAGIGDYCLLLSKKGMNCFAFEPVSDTYQTLVENVNINQLENKIRTYNLALSNDSGEATFNVIKVNTGASHKADLHLKEKHKIHRQEIVRLEKLDNLFLEMNLSRQDHILLKMDMEGMEIQGLEGAADFLKTFPNILIIAESKHSDFHRLIQTLDNIGNFEIGKIDDQNIFARKISSKS